MHPDSHRVYTLTDYTSRKSRYTGAQQKKHSMVLAMGMRQIVGSTATWLDWLKARAISWLELLLWDKESTVSHSVLWQEWEIYLLCYYCWLAENYAAWLSTIPTSAVDIHTDTRSAWIRDSCQILQVPRSWQSYTATVYKLLFTNAKRVFNYSG